MFNGGETIPLGPAPASLLHNEERSTHHFDFFAPSRKTSPLVKRIRSAKYCTAQQKLEAKLDLLALAPSTQNQMSRVLAFEIHRIWAEMLSLVISTADTCQFVQITVLRQRHATLRRGAFGRDFWKVATRAGEVAPLRPQNGDQCRMPRQQQNKTPKELASHPAGENGIPTHVTAASNKCLVPCLSFSAEERAVVLDAATPSRCAWRTRLPQTTASDAWLLFQP